VDVAEVLPRTSSTTAPILSTAYQVATNSRLSRKASRTLSSEVHKDVCTTMVYTHVLNRGGHGVRSQFDGWQGCLYSLGIHETRSRLSGPPALLAGVCGFPSNCCLVDTQTAGRYARGVMQTGYWLLCD